MKTSTRCCVRAAVLALAVGAPSTTSAAAQSDIQLTGGSGVYESDAFCLDTGAFFSVFELSGGGDLVGGSIAYSNGAWPWAGPPPGGALALAPYPGGAGLNRGAADRSGSRLFQEEAFLTHGDAFRIMAETFPVALLSRLPGQREGTLGDINRYIRPFVGLGIHFSGHGEAAPAGTGGRDLPTFGIEGSTNLILSYGARAYLPGRNTPVRLVLLYRANTMFVGDVVFRAPDNGTIRGDGETLTWGEWGVGVSLRIGG